MKPTEKYFQDNILSNNGCFDTCLKMLIRFNPLFIREIHQRHQQLPADYQKLYVSIPYSSGKFINAGWPHPSGAQCGLLFQSLIHQGNSSTRTQMMDTPIDTILCFNPLFIREIHQQHLPQLTCSQPFTMPKFILSHFQSLTRRF